MRNNTLTLSSISLIIGTYLLAAASALAQGRGAGAAGGGMGAGRGPSSFDRSGIGAPSSRPDPWMRPETPARTPDVSRPTMPDNRGIDTAGEHGAAAPAALKLADTMHSINQTSFEARKQLLSDVDMSLSSSRDELRKIQSDARALRGTARDEFRAALDEVKAGRTEVDESVAAAKKSDAASWAEKRGRLNDALQHYSDAMNRLRARTKPAGSSSTDKS